MLLRKNVYTDAWGSDSIVTRILEQHDIKLMFEGMEPIPLDYGRTRLVIPHRTLDKMIKKGIQER